jgi:uncharacterized caspase-like protein
MEGISMQAMSIRIFLILFILIFIYPSSLIAGAEKRTALVIGNGGYSSSPLKNAVNDAADIAANLQRLGFSVILKKNVSHQEMEDAILEFGEQLKKGGVGLFFYAGHGVQKDSRNYLIPIGARINKDTDIKLQAVDAEMVLAEMGNAGNNLNIVILDACRDNPFSKSFRTASRGLAIISDAPKGTFITYSTSPGKVAADGSGRNSPYTESLIKYMNTKGLPIEEVFKEVRKDLGRKTGGQQVPWELSSLEGQFYFSPGKSVKSDTAAKDELDDENSKLEAEQSRLEKEKAAFAKQKALDEKRQQIAEEKDRLAAEKEEARQTVLDRKKKVAEEKQQKIEDERERLAAEKEAARQAALERKQTKKSTTIAMAPRPSLSSANEIKRDGRFIAYDNGTVLDARTNLMWAAKDNGSNINWQGAKSYCDNYRGGGYSDWRMPTQDELAGLYDRNNPKNQPCYSPMNIYLTNLIDLSCASPWTLNTQGAQAAYFDFHYGEVRWNPQSFYDGERALPVRSVK